MKRFNSLILIIILISIIKSKDLRSTLQIVNEYDTSDIINLIEECKTKTIK